jgi:hypothetical protein
MANLSIFTELEITQDLKITNDLEISGNIVINGNINLEDTHSILNLKTIKSNRDITGVDPCGNYIDISGSALLLPRGPYESRMSTTTGIATAKAGMIMYDTSQNQFVGVIDTANHGHTPDLVWTGLGGVISIDQKTKITATNVISDDGLRFYTNDSFNMYINKAGQIFLGDIQESWASTSSAQLIYYKTTTPTFLIANDTTREKNGLQFQLGDDGHSRIFNTYASGKLSLGAGGDSERIIIDTTGNVGIGTPSGDSPSEILDVFGGSIKITKPIQTYAGTNPFLRLKLDPNTNGNGLTSIFLNSSVNDGYGISLSSWRKDEDGSPYFAIKTHTNDAGGVTRLLITKDGNVGIGTESPESALHVVGTAVGIPTTANGKGVQMGCTTSAKISLCSHSTDYSAYIDFTAPNIDYKARILCDLSEQNLKFSTGSPDVMVINANGNVGIGTTIPKAKLHIEEGNINIETKTGVKGVLFSQNDYARSFYIAGETSGAVTDGNLRHLYIGYSDTSAENFVDSTFTNGAKITLLSSGNVGIGTDSPTQTLDVNGQIGINAYIYHNGDDNTLIGFPDNDTFTITTSGAERMRIDANGNVGIGTTSLGYLLHLKSSGDCVLRIEADSNNYGEEDNPLIWMSQDNNSSDYCKIGMVGSAGQIYTGSLGNCGFISTYSTFQIATNGTAKVTVLTNGNVGIGDTSPSYKLDVNGTIRATGQITGNVTGNASTATTLQTARTIGGVSFNGSANINLPGVNSAGNQNTSGSSDSCTGNAETATKATKLNVANNASNANYYVPFMGQSGSDGTFYYNASNYIRINPSTGRVGIGGTSTSYKLYVNGSIAAVGGDIIAFASSDKRFKNNIVPIKNPLEKLKKINGYTFVWKESEHHPNKGNDIGVIAQEIEEVLPEITTTRDNGYKAVRYEKLTPFLISCIKAQQTQISSLQAQIDELKQLIQNKL